MLSALHGHKVVLNAGASQQVDGELSGSAKEHSYTELFGICGGQRQAIFEIAQLPQSCTSPL